MRYLVRWRGRRRAVEAPFASMAAKIAVERWGLRARSYNVTTIDSDGAQEKFVVTCAIMIYTRPA